MYQLHDVNLSQTRTCCFHYECKTRDHGRTIPSTNLVKTAHSCNFLFFSAFGVRTALFAEEWTPAEGADWKETNFEADIQKLEKEAEKRLDEKIAELSGNIESVGKP